MRSALVTLAIVLIAGAGQAHREASEALDRALDHLRSGGLIATLEFTVTRPDREIRYVLELVADGETAGLVRVLAPPRDAGQAFLRLDDNVFLFNPRVGRVLRLPPSGRSDSFLGSDITYGDLAGRDLQRDYASTILEATDTTVTLALTALPGAASPYGLVYLRLCAETLAPLEQIVEDQRGHAVRSITFSEHVDTQGRRFPSVLTVRDLTREGSSTTVRYTAFTLDADIPARCFTQHALEDGCM